MLALKLQLDASSCRGVIVVAFGFSQQPLNPGDIEFGHTPLLRNRGFQATRHADSGGFVADKSCLVRDIGHLCSWTIEHALFRFLSGTVA